MPIEFSCSECLASIRVPDSAGGKNAQCPSCGGLTTAPDSPSTAPVGSPTPSPFGDPAATTANPFQAPTEPYTSVAIANSHFELADRGARLVAVIVDTLAILGPLLALGIGGFLVLGVTEGNDSGWLFASIFFGFGSLFSTAVAIYNMFLTASAGETIGKRLMNVRVVKEADGRPPGFVHGVLLRSWAMALLAQLPFVGLIDALMIFGDRRQCLHDLLASTRVVAGRYRG